MQWLALAGVAILLIFAVFIYGIGRGTTTGRTIPLGLSEMTEIQELSGPTS